MKPVWLGLVGISALLIGCGGAEGELVVGAKLAETSALTDAQIGGAALTIPTSSGELVIERVRLSVGEVELDEVDDDDDVDDDDADDVDDDDDADESDDAEDDADEADDDDDLPGRIVEVALDGRSTEIQATSLPEGTYDELELELRAGAFPEFAGDPPASILVDGRYEGSPFTYRSQVTPEVEFTLAPALELRAGSATQIALTFDVASWFLAESGSILNPLAEGDRQAIEAAILRSMAEHAEVELD